MVNAAPGSPLEDRVICARAWAGRFERALIVGWDPPTVDLLHEELERVAADSTAAGEHSLSSAAVELSAYLCSFVDSIAMPNASQRARLKDLCGSLAAADRLRCNHDDARGATTGTAAIELAPRVPEPLPACRLLAAVASVALSEEGLGRSVFAE